MSTTYNVVASKKAIVPARPGLTVFQKWLAAFHEWRQRNRVRADLHGLSDRELMDMGIGRGEVDYVASNRSFDPRGAA
jgi:uncharacterized protein YjiS (DUF1127 family)